MYLPFLDLFIPLCKSIFPSGIVFLLYERLLIFFYSAGLLGMNCSVFCLKDTLCCLCFERYLHWVRSSKLTVVFFCCFKDVASLFPGLHCFKREISCHPTLHSWVHNVSFSLDDFNFFLYHQVLSNVLCALIFFFLMFLVFEFLEILKFVGLLISLHLEIFQHFSSIISSVVSYSPSSDQLYTHLAT